MEFSGGMSRETFISLMIAELEKQRDEDSERFFAHSVPALQGR